MPVVGLGLLHVLIALFFAVHALRSGQQLFWLFILFSFPLLGSVVYFLVIYLPNSRLQRGARKVVAAASRTLDPSKELREAQAAFDYTPTAQNQMRLAAAQLEAGMAAEAAASYTACLKGPFATDLEIRLGAARAYFASGRNEDAITHLRFIRETDASFRAEQASLLLAQALGAAGRGVEAQQEFESALSRFGSFETQAEYAIWAAAAGEHAVASRLQPELQRTMERWTRHTRELHKPLVRRLNEAFAALRAGGA
jgi:hypothetical protein